MSLTPPTDLVEGDICAENIMEICKISPHGHISCFLSESILVMWLECQFLDAEVEGSNPSISMLCVCARHFICIA